MSLEQEILIIQESLEDYINNFSSKKEIININSKWIEIKKAIKNNRKIKNTSIIYFALMSYCEEAISSEKERIDLIDSAWLKIKNKVL